MSDLFKVKHGFAFDGKYFTSEGEYILLTPGNFHDEGGFKLKDKEKYYVGDIPTDYVLKRGDLLVAMTEQAEGLLGSSAIVPESNRFLHNQRLGLITEYKRDLIDTSFLYYLFNTRDVRLQIRATASGVKVRHTSPSRIGEVKVRIPSVSTQHKVASILSAYDDLIENNTRRIAILEAMVQTIYREWFVDFRFPGHEKVKLVDLPLGKIPEGWVMKTLGTVVSLRTEGVVPSDYPEEVFAHYSFPAFDAGVLPSLECGSTIKSNKHIVQDNCVLLAKLNPRIPRIWLPYLGGSWRPICSTEFLVVVPDTLVTKEFLYCLFQSCTFRDAFGGGAIGTSTSHQRVKPDDFKGRQLLVPPPEVVHSFTEMVLPILRLQHTMRIRNVNLRTTRDLLLPKLISGQLDVEDLDIETGQTVTMTE